MGFSISRGQRTLRQRVTLSGVGVHSGKPVRVTLCPADPGSGILFLRTDVPGAADLEIPALSSSIGATELCTVLGDPRGISVATVEHLLAALHGLAIDNAVIEVEGSEVPVMDGSAEPFVAAIDRAGIAVQNAPKRFIRVRKQVRVEMGSAFAEFRPYRGRRFEVGIAYDCSVIGRQAVALELTPKTFRREIARARTYGYLKDLQRLWAAGYALGSSLENSVGIGENGVVNPEGLRFPDEFARHKLLDAVGDLALAGAPIQGLYRSSKGGHKLNAMALDALLSQKDAWVMVTARTRREARSGPGAELFSGILGPAFAPEAP